jgi:hypothetical protein
VANRPFSFRSGQEQWMEPTKPMSEKEFAQWGKTRSKGQFRFVISITLLFAVGFFFSNTLTDWLWGDPVDFKWSRIVIGLIVGLIAAMSFWWLAESRYQKQILDKRK